MVRRTKRGSSLFLGRARLERLADIGYPAGEGIFVSVTEYAAPVPRWLKILLVLLGAAVGLLGLGMGGFAWWLSSHRAQLRAEGKQAEQAGQAYARNRDSSACVRESVARLGRTGGFIEQALVGHFLEACLKSARRGPSLCTEVPETREIVKSALWRARACAAFGKPDDQACGRLFGKVQEVCHPR